MDETGPDSAAYKPRLLHGKPWLADVHTKLA
jgi:hypothetical protein